MNPRTEEIMTEPERAPVIYNLEIMYRAFLHAAERLGMTKEVLAFAGSLEEHLVEMQNELAWGCLIPGQKLKDAIFWEARRMNRRSSSGGKQGGAI